MASKAGQFVEQYHRAKMWQIGFFALNNTATNLYLFIVGFVSYYATGIAGLSVVIISSILTAMRAFDAVTDPIIGFIIDKTETKFGKFRPMMIIGNVILASTVLIMYNVTHLLPESLQFLFFVFIYAIYIVGYTIQTAVTRAAQTVLTNHPKQRPLFTIFDASYNVGIFTGGQIFVASYLMVKHGNEFNMGLFTELNSYAIILSALFTVLAVIAIAPKDRKEFFGLAEKSVKVKFRDYWPILKSNRPLQMLVLAASTDKLANLVLRQPVVFVMFFGILLGDYALSGTVSLIVVLPTILITFLGVKYAGKLGLKKALVGATWGGLISAVVLCVYFLVIDPSTISLTNIGLTTIGFLVLYALMKGLTGLSSSIVIPMIADVSDYETYKSGRYVPGMVGTLFSFVDKMVSSLAPAIVGFLVATIGYSDTLPQVGEALTPSLMVMTLVLMFGIPAAGLAISLIAMKFYHLDGTKMEEIQASIAEVKRNANKDNKQAI
ncbi:MFS transporter [Sutcliffiella cohnii]